MLNSDNIDHYYTYNISYLTVIESKEFILFRFLKDLDWRLLVLECWRRLFSSSKASAIKVIKLKKGFVIHCVPFGISNSYQKRIGLVSNSIQTQK